MSLFIIYQASKSVTL